LFQTLNKVVQRVSFFHPLAGNLFISLTAPQHLARYNFLSKILFSAFKAISFYCLFASKLASASLSWQRLQLVLCYINSFNGRVSGIDERLIKSNIIDNLRFLEEL